MIDPRYIYHWFAACIDGLWQVAQLVRFDEREVNNDGYDDRFDFLTDGETDTWCPAPQDVIIGPIARPGRAPTLSEGSHESNLLMAERLAREFAVSMPRSAVLLAIGAATSAIRAHHDEHEFGQVYRVVERELLSAHLANSLTMLQLADALGLNLADAQELVERSTQVPVERTEAINFSLSEDVYAGHIEVTLIAFGGEFKARRGWYPEHARSLKDECYRAVGLQLIAFMRGRYESAMKALGKA